MSTTQPEALRLAAGLESIFISEEVHATKAQAIAAELRRLHQSEREGWRHANELEQERKRLRAENAALHARVQELGQMARDVNSRRVVELEAQLASISPPDGMAGWISVDDRLPEWAARDDTPCFINGKSVPPTLTSETVLVALKGGGVRTDKLTTIEGKSAGWWHAYGERVIAWQKLPPPPLASEAKGASHADQA